MDENRYYIGLMREALSKAEGDLQRAQEYVSIGKLGKRHFRKLQELIESIRAENDAIGRAQNKAK